MSAITAQERSVKEIVLGKCWNYLNENFHKFTEQNKIKVAMALACKNLPQEMTANLTVTQMPAIEKAGQQLVFNIGQTPPS